MQPGKINLGIGLVLGIILAAIFFHIYAPRHVTVKSQGMIIKQDKWTGKSWRFVDNEWKPIININRDWGKIDHTLRGALQIPTAQMDTESALKLLRGQYSIFKDLSDYELLERIKLVYSKQIIVNMYLSNFLKAQKATADGNRKEEGAGSKE